MEFMYVSFMSAYVYLVEIVKDERLVCDYFLGNGEV